VTVIQAFFLGIVQGITEFLPVSSKGHLALFQYFFGLENLDGFIVFDLVLHLGTLCSIFVVFHSQILKLFAGDSVRVRQIIIGTLPLFPIVFILKPIESLFDKPYLFGFFFILTAGILYAGIRWGYNKTPQEKKKSWWKDALVIGFFQTMALLPGVSRSGSTISAARLVGWDKQDAITFSFLLAIPAILGGSALKLLQITFLGGAEVNQMDLPQYLIGFVAAFLVGYAALMLLIRLASKDKFMYFVWYCLALGLLTSFYFL
jgi:undecaprenyl-diphosphatase